MYSETDGGKLGQATAAEPMVNPPLFAWVEWRYYIFTGDDSRLPSVFPLLEAYYDWLRANVRVAVDTNTWLYYQTDLGSGMDNTPRGVDQAGAWADMSAQQALAARLLAEMAAALGQPAREQ